MSDRLRNICFVQGLASDRIQTIARSRDYRDFDKIAETALIEESAITSRQDRSRIEGNAALKCTMCGMLGHLGSKCFTQEERHE